MTDANVQSTREASQSIHSGGPVLQDQLLVVTPYVNAVLSKLNDLAVPLASKTESKYLEHSKALGLSRIFLAPAFKNVLSTLLREELDRQRKEGATASHMGIIPTSVLSQRKDDYVGLLIYLLQRSFARTYGGWYPTMGRNRGVGDNVAGGGSMIYGGLDEPGHVEKEAKVFTRLKRTWTNRPSQPGSGVKVGVVDTQVSLTSQLAGAILTRSTDILRVPAPYRAGHATFVAGVILSAAPGASLEVRGVLDENGRANSWDAANAIVELGNSGVDILNLSFGCMTGDGQAPLALTTAVDLISSKTVVVSSAGNLPRMEDRKKLTLDLNNGQDIDSAVSFPAALNNVIAVGSTTPLGEWDYSPRGAWIDAYADGTAVTSTFLDTNGYKGFARWTGTSFSAALVSGAIAQKTKPGEVYASGAWQHVRQEAERNPETGVFRSRKDESVDVVVVSPDRWVR